MAFKGIIYERPGQGMRVRPTGGLDQDVGEFVFDQMNQGDVSGLVDDLVRPGAPVAAAQGFSMAPPRAGLMQVAAGPTDDAGPGENPRRSYSAGAMSADEYRASMGFNDPRARGARFQIAQRREERMERRRSAAELAKGRMAMEAEMFKPVSLGGGAVAQMGRDGQLKVQYPPAQPRAVDPVAVNPGQTLVDPASRQPIYSAPAAPGEMKVIPEGGMGVVPGQAPVVNPKRPEPRVEVVGGRAFRIEDGANSATQITPDPPEKPERFDNAYYQGLWIVNPAAADAYMKRLADGEMKNSAGGKADGSASKQLDTGTAAKFLREAGGDKAKARAAAKAAGFTF